MSADENVRFTIQRSKRDHLAGILLNARYSRWTWVYWVAPVINGAIAFHYSDGDSPEVRLAAVLGIFVVSAAVMFVLIRLCFVLGAFMSWRVPGALRPIDYELDAEGVYARAESGSGKSNWSVFDGVFENRHVLVIRQRPGMLHIIPKRDLSDAQTLQIRRMLRQHVNGVLRMKGADQ